MTVGDRTRRAASAVGLASNQLAVMLTSFALSFELARAGGVAAVGAVASAVLVFQLTLGVLQTALSEASVLAVADASSSIHEMVPRRSIAIGLFGGVVGMALAAGLSAFVGADPRLGIVYACGIPAAVALDLGRTGAVASRSPWNAATDAAGWTICQAAAMHYFASRGSTLGICAATAVVSWIFFIGLCVVRYRRPAFRGTVRWLWSQRSYVGYATRDAVLAGLAPLVAVQVASVFCSVATVGTVRLVQQVLSPLSLVTISLRKVFVYQRSTGTATSRFRELRDGVVGMLAIGAGSAVFIVTIVVLRPVVPAFAIVPVGSVLLVAGLDRLAQGFAFGCSLNRFVRRDYASLLWPEIILIITLAVAPTALAVSSGPPGYLVGSALAFFVFATAVVVIRPARVPSEVGAVARA